MVSLLLVFGVALPAGAIGILAGQEAGEPDATKVERNLTVSPQDALEGRSYVGNAYAVLTDSGEFIFFRSTNGYTNNTTGTFTDLNGNRYTGRVFAGFENVNNNNAPYWESYKTQITSVRVAPGQAIKPKRPYGWFYNCNNLVRADLTGFDISQTASLQYLFANCTKLTEVDVSALDTTNDGLLMGFMFMGCSSLEYLDISNFDTRKVNGMRLMFYDMTSLKEIKLGEHFSFRGNGTFERMYQATLPFPDMSTGQYTGRWTNGTISGSPRELQNSPEGTNLAGTWIPEEGTSPLPNVVQIESGTLMERNPLYISDGMDVFAKEHDVKQPIRIVNIKVKDESGQEKPSQGDPTSPEVVWPYETSRVTRASEAFNSYGWGVNGRTPPYKTEFLNSMQVAEYCNTGWAIIFDETWTAGTPVSLEVEYPCVGSHDGRPVKARLKMDATVSYGEYTDIGTYRRPYGYDTAIVWLTDLFYAGGFAMNLKNCEVAISFYYTDTGEQVDLRGSGLSYNSMNYYGRSSESLILPPEATGTIAVLKNGNVRVRSRMFETSYDEDISIPKHFFEAHAINNSFPDKLHNPPLKDFNKNSAYFTTTDPDAFHYVIGGSGYDSVFAVTGWFAFSSATLDAEIPDPPTKTVKNTSWDNTSTEIGETVTYTIKQPIPSSANMLETYNSLVFTDTLPAELSFKDLKVLDEEGNDVTAAAGTVNVDGNKVTYTFKKEYLAYVEGQEVGMLYIGGDMTFVLSGTVREHMGGRTATNQASTTFNNDWTFDTNKVTTVIPIRYGELQVSKKIAGDAADPSHKFDFILTVLGEDGNELKDISFACHTYNAEGDVIDETNIYSGGTFTLKGGESVTISGIPEYSTWQVKEKASTSHGYEIEPVQGELKGAEAETGTITYGTPSKLAYTNEKNKGMGALKISKAVAGDAADSEQDFTFILTFKDEAGNEITDGEFAYTGSREGIVSSGGTLQLKHGESVTIEGLPEDTHWSITEEAESSHGYEIEAVQGELKGKAAESGVIAPGGTSEISYTNEKNSKMGGLRISKSVAGDAADANKLFHFQLRLYNPDGTELTDGEFSFTGDESGIVASGGTFPLKHGETVELAGVPEGVSWEVKEVVADAHGYEIEPVRSEIRGTAAESGAIVANEYPLLSYTNEKNSTMGAISLSKNVVGEGADLGREFSFTVSIGDDPETDIDESSASEFAYTGSREGFVANGGTIALKHGETVTIEGLPAGTPYEITEVPTEGYESSSEGATGTIAAKTTSAAVFTNTYKAPGTPSPTPTTTPAPAQNAKPAGGSAATGVPRAGDGSAAVAAVVVVLAAAGAATIGISVRRRCVRHRRG